MKHLFAIGATAALMATAALATEPKPGAALGTTIEEVQAALMAEDYMLTKYEREDGRVEVVAIDQDLRLELYLDPVSGEVLSLYSRKRGGQGAQAGMKTPGLLSNLKSQGYEVVGFERKRGQVEVYARKDGQLWELTIDARTGEMLRSEREG